VSPGRIVLGARRLLRRAAAERELNDEVAHYLEMAAAEYERRGLPRDEAMRLARLDFAGVENAKEAVRDADWDGWLASFLRDFGLGARGLRRNPGFAIVAILTLALGIGANTAMFSVVNAVLLRPLPYREPSRLALLWTDDVRRDLHEEATAYRVIQDWRARNTTFQDLAYFSARRVDLVDGSDRERSRGAHVSGNLFALLGARPLRGRVIVPSDEENAANVVVISHALWLRRFHGDSSVIGRTLAADVAGKGDALTMQIVGVMPASFYFPDKTTELWIPSTLYWRFTRERDERFPEWARNWTAVGRLKPGVALSAARADLDRVA
jgi:hypothetical protein